MDIREIRDAYNNGKYSAPSEDLLRQLPIDYIFDEELSVRRNREMVEEHNNKVKEQSQRRYMSQVELSNKLTEDIVNYIKENYELTDSQGRLVEQFAYREYHSSMCDYFDNIDTFAYFAEVLIKCGLEE